MNPIPGAGLRTAPSPCHPGTTSLPAAEIRMALCVNMQIQAVGIILISMHTFRYSKRFKLIT